MSGRRVFGELHVVVSTAMTNRLRTYLVDTSGATAAEFGLVIGVFLMLVFGTIGLSIALWANSTLQYATQVAARCASIQPYVNGQQTCTNSTQIVAYAKSHYLGPGLSSLTFSSSQTSCDGVDTGYTVTGTGSMQIIEVGNPLTLTASACFPKN